MNGDINILDCILFFVANFKYLNFMFLNTNIKMSKDRAKTTNLLVVLWKNEGNCDYKRQIGIVYKEYCPI